MAKKGSKKHNGLKELLILICATLVIILIFVGINFISSYSNAGEFFDVTEEISEKQFKKKLKDNEDFILFIGANDDQLTKDYRPDFATAVINSKPKTDVYYLNTSKLNGAEEAELQNDYGYSSNPVVIEFVDGVYYDSLEGVNTVEDTETFIQDINIYLDNKQNEEAK